MTAKELHKLSRKELLELMVLISEENERLYKQIEQLNEKLNTRNIIVQEVGSIAEAALKISGVIEATQVAADLYLENIRRLNNNAQKNAAILMQETRQKCVAIETEKQQKTGSNLHAINEWVGPNFEDKQEMNRWFNAARGRGQIDEDTCD
ncbi:hypothetical protein [Acetobacterium paludosum]|uniref:hypothetical protein n=1 Tax=Acetobacterium paludosum TaxID=52693 RepID=UPI00197A91FF|nr:hypothetical protein [Acetobacterium paludosum]